MTARERPSPTASETGTAVQSPKTSVSSSIVEEPAIFVEIAAPPLSVDGLRACSRGNEAAVATFWGEEERNQRLVEDFPLEFAAWQYRPKYYVTYCLVLGVVYLVQSILISWRSPYGNTNVRPQPVPVHRYPAILYSHVERLLSIVKIALTFFL